MTRITLGFLLSGLLAACSAPQPPLRVGLVEWPPHQIAHLATQMDCAGADSVELVDFKSLSDAARAYASGNLDAVGLTMDYALDFHGKDRGHRVFLFVNESLGGDTVIGAATVTELKQIRGKRVGLENSALGTHMLRRMLDKAGLAMSDVRPVYVDYVDQAPAFRSGKVDAIITGEPTRTALLKEGGREIFSSKDIPGEIFDVFLAKQPTLEARRTDLEAFSRCWFKALGQFQKDPKAGAAFMGRGVGLDEGDFLATMQGVRMFSLEQNRRMLGTGNETLLGGVSRFADSLKKMGRTDLAENVAGLFTDGALPPAH